MSLRNDLLFYDFTGPDDQEDLTREGEEEVSSHHISIER